MRESIPERGPSRGPDPDMARELDAAFGPNVLPAPASDQMLEALAHAKMLKFVRTGAIAVGVAALLAIIATVVLISRSPRGAAEQQPIEEVHPAEGDLSEFGVSLLGGGSLLGLWSDSSLMPNPPPAATPIPLLQSRAGERVPPIPVE